MTTKSKKTTAPKGKKDDVNPVVQKAITAASGASKAPAPTPKEKELLATKPPAPAPKEPAIITLKCGIRVVSTSRKGQVAVVWEKEKDEAKAFELGLKLGLAVGTLHSWFSFWRKVSGLHQDKPMPGKEPKKAPEPKVKAVPAPKPEPVKEPAKSKEPAMAAKAKTQVKRSKKK